MEAVSLFFHEDTITCQQCKKRRMVRIVNTKYRSWHEVPPGWRVADSYPPGDDGLYFICSDKCMRALSEKEGTDE